jgi:glycosyltransferase involved in cell wall biosynthesis
MDLIETNNKNNIILSIIIPFHNRAELLINTINSFKNNSSDDYEIILVDDESSIDQYNKINDFIKDENIFLYRIKKKERGFARNYGASKARGQYLNFFDSDDIALDNHINSFKHFIINNNYPNIFSNSYYVKNSKNNKSQKIIHKRILNNQIFKNNILSCNATFIKKDFFLKFKFSTIIELSGSEDWELWLRIASQNLIYGNRIVSSIIIDHTQRTTRVQDFNKIYNRLNFLHICVKNKTIFKQINKLKSIESEIYSFKSLINSPFTQKKFLALLYLIYSIYLRPLRIIEKRTMIIIFKIIFKFT